MEDDGVWALHERALECGGARARVHPDDDGKRLFGRRHGFGSCGTKPTRWWEGSRSSGEQTCHEDTPRALDQAHRANSTTAAIASFTGGKFMKIPESHGPWPSGVGRSEVWKRAHGPCTCFDSCQVSAFDARATCAKVPGQQLCRARLRSLTSPGPWGRACLLRQPMPLRPIERPAKSFSTSARCVIACRGGCDSAQGQRQRRAAGARRQNGRAISPFYRDLVPSWSDIRAAVHMQDDCSSPRLAWLGSPIVKPLCQHHIGLISRRSLGSIGDTAF